MKKTVSLLLIAALFIIAVTGCSKAADEKMCKIEIADADKNVIAVLENQSQADIMLFFDESKWQDSQENAENLSIKFVISVYQEKTETVIKTGSDEYEKIMEYTTFENSDMVKVFVGGDVVGDIISDDLLNEYYIASSDFFEKINNTVSMKTV